MSLRSAEIKPLLFRFVKTISPLCTFNLRTCSFKLPLLIDFLWFFYLLPHTVLGPDCHAHRQWWLHGLLSLLCICFFCFLVTFDFNKLTVVQKRLLKQLIFASDVFYLNLRTCPMRPNAYLETKEIFALIMFFFGVYNVLCICLLTKL